MNGSDALEDRRRNALLSPAERVCCLRHWPTQSRRLRLPMPLQPLQNASCVTAVGSGQAGRLASSARCWRFAGAEPVRSAARVKQQACLLAFICTCCHQVLGSVYSLPMALLCKYYLTFTQHMVQHCMTDENILYYVLCWKSMQQSTPLDVLAQQLCVDVHGRVR